MKSVETETWFYDDFYFHIQVTTFNCSDTDVNDVLNYDILTGNTGADFNVDENGTVEVAKSKVEEVPNQ